MSGHSAGNPPGQLGVVTADEDGVEAVASGRRAVVVDVGTGERPDAPEPPAPSPDNTPAPAAEPEAEEDFEALLLAAEQMTAETTSFVPGEAVAGVVEVISLHGSEVFLDLGGKATGYVLKEELLDADGELTVAQGDRIEGVVAEISGQGVRVRTRVSGDAGVHEDLRVAMEANLPVDGKVTGMNKGGYEVQVGKVSAFCPMGQIDLYRPSDPNSYVGQTLSFKVLELKSRSAVLSRFQLLREERESRADETRASLEEGATVSGIVSRIQPFGAFVDLGGIDGLIHVSELAWERVEDPQHIVRVGQTVEVVILEIDQGRDRIALSLRRASPDPMHEALSGVQMGATIEGKVVRVTNFGAFVNLSPGVDGMIHVSDMAHHHVRHPKEVLDVGDTVTTRVVKVDLERRRIGLSLKALAGDPWEGASERYAKGTTVQVEVLRVERFGVFVRLQDGLQALLPAKEADLPQGRALAAAFRPGQTVEARILRVDTREKKIALTQREQQEGSTGPRTWTDDSSAASSDVGSFGALLAQALDDKSGAEEE